MRPRAKFLHITESPQERTMKDLTPPPAPDQALFAHAVALAAAFVANGDIRLGKGIHSGSALPQIEDLIPALYQSLAQARQTCADATEPD
jgi:hypothetical protein